MFRKQVVGKNEQRQRRQRLYQIMMIKLLASRRCSFYALLCLFFGWVYLKRFSHDTITNTNDKVLIKPLPTSTAVIDISKHKESLIYMGKKEKNSGWYVDTLCLIEKHHHNDKKQKIQQQTTQRFVAYGFGAGLDISWDIGMVEKLGVDEMHIFDPTEKSIQYVEPIIQRYNHLHHEKLYKKSPLFFTPVGLSNHKGTISFALPANKKYVSMRSVDMKENDMTRTVSAKVDTLQNLMTERNHTYLDVLKIDIEGAEYDVLESLLADDFLPFTQLLVEYHERFLDVEKKERHQNVVRGLKQKGFIEIWNQNNHQEVGYVKVTDLDYCADGVSPRSASSSFSSTSVITTTLTTTSSSNNTEDHHHDAPRLDDATTTTASLQQLQQLQSSTLFP